SRPWRCELRRQLLDQEIGERADAAGDEPAVGGEEVEVAGAVDEAGQDAHQAPLGERTPDDGTGYRSDAQPGYHALAHERDVVAGDGAADLDRRRAAGPLDVPAIHAAEHDGGVARQVRRAPGRAVRRDV